MPRNEENMIILRVVVYPENGSWWIAHCLEMDIATEGKTRLQAMRDLDSLVRLQIQSAIEDGNIDSIWHPAPASLWTMFAKGKGLNPRLPHATPPVGKLEAREWAYA